MSMENSEALGEGALLGFKVMYSAMLRAITLGKMKTIPCIPDGVTNTVRVGNQHFKLISAEPGAFGVVLDNEPQKMQEQAEAIGELRWICKELLSDKRELLAQNQALRELLSPLEESVSFVSSKNSQNGDLESAHTFRKKG